MKIEGRDQLTREGLADVKANRVIDHQPVQAWADSLDSNNPLPAPSTKKAAKETALSKSSFRD